MDNERGSITGKTDFELRIEAVVRAVLARELASLFDPLREKDEEQNKRLEMIWLEIAGVKEALQAQQVAVSEVDGFKSTLGISTQTIEALDDEIRARAQYILQSHEQMRTQLREDQEARRQSRSEMVQMLRQEFQLADKQHDTQIGALLAWQVKADKEKSERKTEEVTITTARIGRSERVMIAAFGIITSVVTALLTYLATRPSP